MRRRLSPIALLLASILAVVGLAGPGGMSPAKAAPAEAAAARAAADLGGQVSFSSFLGGNDVDSVAGIAVDAANNIYITGTTSSTDFPANGSFQPQFAGISDVFVIKLSPDGQRVIYATYLGGANLDEAGGIAVDAAGHAYVVGLAGNVSSGQKRFPVTTGAYGAANAASGGAFVAKLAPDGASLVYSAIIGDVRTQGAAIALAADGSVTIAGVTTGGLPVVNPVQASYAGGQGDLFVTRLSAAGDTLHYATYLGGSDREEESLGRIGLAVDADGAAYVSCTTRSTDMPIMNAAQPTYGGGILGDAYLASLSAAGGLRFATYLGGSGTDQSGDVVVAPWGEVIVSGFTQSNNFPQPAGRLFGNAARNSRAFVTRFGAADGAIRSTALIADAWYVQRMALDTAGRLTIVGNSAGTSMPLTLPHQPVFGGVSDGFVVQLSGDGGRLIYSSFIGGDYFDNAYAVAARPDGGVVVGGETRSAPATFGLRSPIQPTYGGDIADGFVRALDVIHDVYIPTLTR